MAEFYNEIIAESNRFLTNFATSYKVMYDVADFVAPPFQVRYEDGKYVEYDKSQLTIWDDRIKGSEEAKEIQWDVDESTYSCLEYSLSKFVSNKKRAQAVDPIDLDKDAVRMIKQAHYLSREYRVNQIAGNNALITTGLSVAAAWGTSAGTPIKNILDGMSTVVQNTSGTCIPNAILIPIEVALKMVQTTEWQTYKLFTGAGNADGVVNVVKGLEMLGLQVKLASNYGVNVSKSSSDPDTESLWSDSVLLFYRESNPTLESRSLMYSPYVAKDVIFTTNVPRRRGLYHDIYSDIDELLVDANCGYLFTNCI